MKNMLAKSRVTRQPSRINGVALYKWLESERAAVQSRNWAALERNQAPTWPVNRAADVSGLARIETKRFSDPESRPKRRRPPQSTRTGAVRALTVVGLSARLCSLPIRTQ